MDKIKDNKEIAIGLLLGLIIISGVWLLQKSPDAETTTATQSSSNTQSNIQSSVQAVDVPAPTAEVVASSNVVLEDSDGEVDWSELQTIDVTLGSGGLSITEAGTYVITGTSSGGIVINTEGNVRLALNGVSIVSSSGAAINVENADNTVVYLVDGSENYLEDSSTRSDQDIDGTIYSSDDLIFTGTGKLSVKSNYADAIVSKDDLHIYDGTIVINSVDEGIRGKDSIYISGGDISVTAADDGIKATNETDPEKGYIRITGGTIVVSAGDDGVKAVTTIVIDDGSVNVASSVEGLEAGSITINGGDVSVAASDDGINAVADGHGSDVYIAITGGNVNVTVGTGDTDGLDSNGDVYITGGVVNITAPGMASVDYDDNGEFTGGTLIVNGEQLTELPAHMMGGPGGGGFR